MTWRLQPWPSSCWMPARTSVGVLLRVRPQQVCRHRSGRPRAPVGPDQPRAGTLSAGFFYITGYGMSQAELERLLGLCRRLFDLPGGPTLPTPERCMADTSCRQAPTNRMWRGDADRHVCTGGSTRRCELRMHAAAAASPSTRQPRPKTRWTRASPHWHGAMVARCATAGCWDEVVAVLMHTNGALNSDGCWISHSNGT